MYVLAEIVELLRLSFGANYMADLFLFIIYIYIYVWWVIRCVLGLKYAIRGLPYWRFQRPSLRARLSLPWEAPGVLQLTRGATAIDLVVDDAPHVVEIGMGEQGIIKPSQSGRLFF